jgi:hypothetical protein
MFVAVSYALGAARKAIILLGATKMLFDGVLPFFRVLEKPATGWIGSQFISLALLGGGGSIHCLVLPRWGWSYGA